MPDTDDASKRRFIPLFLVSDVRKGNKPHSRLSNIFIYLWKSSPCPALSKPGAMPEVTGALNKNI